jgi:hypothetical protein
VTTRGADQPARELVPGDLIEITSGEPIPLTGWSPQARTCRWTSQC